MNTNQRRLLDISRDKLVHIVPRLEVCGVLSFVYDVVGSMKDYYHVILHETDLKVPNDEIVTSFHGQGCDVLQVDRVTFEAIDALNATGAVFYNTVGQQYTGLGSVLPSVYYSYGMYDERVRTNLTVPCSTYAATQLRSGQRVQLDPDWVVPPFIDTRTLRRIAGSPNKFTVGLITSGYAGKYPYELYTHLLQTLPSDIRILISMYDGMDTQFLSILAEAEKRRYPNILRCPVRHTGTLRYTVHADVVVHGSSADHYDPYGRTVVEAMAMGKIAICERRGVFGVAFEHAKDGLLFSSKDEVVEYVTWLRRDTSSRNQLAANGQLWASWQDASIHMSKLRRILKIAGI